jgi:hypothetical protein
MRRISFAMTTDAVLARTKTVTRRVGWKFAKVGDRLLAVDKLRTKNARKLAIIEIVDVRREVLAAMYLTDPLGTAGEGMPGLTITDFIELFCTAMKCEPWTEVTRIEFRYVAPAPTTVAYLIVDMTRTKASGSVVFWKPNGCGYTMNFDAAGWYTKREIESVTLVPDSDNIAIPLPVAKQNLLADRTMSKPALLAVRQRLIELEMSDV